MTSAGGTDTGRLPRVLRTVTALQRAVGALTVEEFRIEDFRFERDSRLGREVLFLLTNNEWGRRTTELIDVARSRHVDTEIVIDVDPAHLNHEALRPGEPMVWLPILALPVEHANPRPRRAGRRRAFGPDAVRRDVSVPDPVTSLEVTGPDGARITRVAQAEVQHWLSAALAEVLLHRIPRPPAGAPDTDRRDQAVALAAAIRRLLPRQSGPRVPGLVGHTGPAAADRPGGAAAAGDEPQVRRVEGRLDEACTALLATFEHDLGRYRPVLQSRLMEIVEALLGTVLVVVAVDRSDPPTSFTVRLPSRRQLLLDRRLRLRPQARIRVDLMTATASADRLVRLALPVGVTWSAGDSADRGGRDTERPAVARVAVLPPPPLDQVRSLTMQLTRAPDAPVDWVDRRLADLAVDKVEASLECLLHYQVPGRPGVAADRTSEEFAVHLSRLRAALAAVARRDHSSDEVGIRRRRELAQVWDGGIWMPERLHRRLVVNATSPESVHLRAGAIEDFTQRAEPTAASVDVDVRVQDSAVLDTARDTNGLNLLLLVFVLGLLAWHNTTSSGEGLRLDALATVLTLFPAIQASRVQRPDSSTLAGLLSRPGYWLSLASAVPAILLAAAVAVLSEPALVTAAVVAVAAQAGLHLLILSPSMPGARRRPPPLTLTTTHAPDHERFDVLRTTWCRTLAAEALNLGRPAHAIIVLGSERPGALGELLQAAQGEPGRDAVRANLLAVFRGGVAGMAMTLLVFRDEPAPRWQLRDRALVRHVLLDPGRLSPAEPPEWVIEVLVGMPEGAGDAVELARHPMVHLVNAAGANNFRVMFVQLPATPPRKAQPGRTWMRLRVGVPYRRYDSLAGLRRFLSAVHELRAGHHPVGQCIAMVQIVPEVATLDATQTAPEEAFDPPARLVSGLRPVVDRELEVRPLDPGSVWRPFAFCANARAGLIADILRTLSERRGTLRLASATSAVVHGLSATFLLCRDSDPAEPAEGRLGALVAREMAGTDQLEVPIDGRSWASPLLVLPDAGPRPLLRLQVRTGDRPGMLQGVLGWLTETLHRVGGQLGIAEEGLDVWAALVRVVDGHTLQGRLTVRLPSDAGARRSWGSIDWAAVDWTAGARAAVVTAGALAPPDPSAPPTLSLDGPSARLDDGSVVTIDLVRTS